MDAEDSTQSCTVTDVCLDNLKVQSSNNIACIPAAPAHPAACSPRQYTGYREEVGTLPDGRHFKNYYLLDDSGAEKLMVMAEDGARLDRRYTYKAVEDVGGFCFENGKAVGTTRSLDAV
eukprot:GHUV01028539.1.p3 GENE.GHUV01028539.1~~GHUV01028539.1.p3  ORF type:complete len:119 (-),score=36.04 GHUV01028539.1:882-1238(-)